MARALLLNVSQVEFPDAEVTIGILPFESSDQLDTLRQNHLATHLVRRHGQEIQFVAVAPNVAVHGERTTYTSLHRDLPLAAALIRRSFVEYFLSLGRAVEDVHPVKFVGAGDHDDFLHGASRSGIDCTAWLSVGTRYALEVRVLHLDQRNSFVGVAFNVRSMRRITATCDKWIARGLDVRGLYVGREIANRDSRLTPRFQLLGKVSTVRDGTLVLDDARHECPEVLAAEVTFEARNDAFSRCFGEVFGREADFAKKVLNDRLNKLRSGPGRIDRLSKAVSFLRSKALPMLPNANFQINSFLEEHKSPLFPTVLVAPKPVFVFDASGSRTDTWNDGGLRKHGPYSADVFTPSRPRICVICQSTKKGQIDQFLHKFLYGIRPNAQSRAPFSDGFVRKFALEGVSHEFFVTEGITTQAYQRAARTALEKQQATGNKWDLALVQIDEDFHNLYGEENPYYVIKATFLAQQINVQEFEIETVTTTNETQLGYSLNNMALACYAKLGGTPWLLRSDRTRAHELVIGLGSALIGEGRLGNRERVVGITTVFSGDGNYYLSSASKSVPMAEYKDALLLTLRNSVERAKNSMNWQARDHVRLVFHSFKPMKGAEIDAVKEFMASFGSYDVDYAFLEVVEDHPYLIFDRSQLGVSTYGATIKGALAPTRGWFFRLSELEVLLCLTGAKELKKPEDGMPWPVLIRLHRDSTFKDTTYLTKQVYAFASHSWRSFFPSSVPVTIMYSELVAGMLGKLAKLSWWNPDAMLGRVGETRWFL